MSRGAGCAEECGESKGLDCFGWTGLVVVLKIWYVLVGEFWPQSVARLSA